MILTVLRHATTRNRGKTHRPKPPTVTSQSCETLRDTYCRGRPSSCRLRELVSLHQKSHQNLLLLNFKCAVRISNPRGTPTHKRPGAHREFRKRPQSNYRRYLSLTRVRVATIDVIPKKYQFKHKKLKNS